MKRVKICMCVILTGICITVSSYAEITDRIVATVNGEVITLSELNSAYAPYLKRIEETYKGADKEKLIAENRTAMLNRLIDTTLIDQEAKKSGIVITDTDAMESINDILSRRKIKMDDLIAELAKENSSLDAYKKEVKGHLTRMRLVRRELKSKITVSEEEIGDHYLKHREAYEGREAVRIKHILLMFPKGADREVKAKLRAQMNAIHERLRAGESFDILAIQYSQGPAAASGGDIGFIEKGLMLPAVESAAFSLKKDEISNVIESPVGLHIIKAIDKRGAGIKPIESVREELKMKIEEDKMDKKYDEWIKGMRSKSLIEIKL